MKHQKHLSILLVLVLTLLAFAGCGESKEETGSQAPASQVTSSQSDSSAPAASEDTQSTADQTESSDQATSTPATVDDADAVAKGFITTKEAFATKMNQWVDLSLYQPMSGSENYYSYTLNSQNHKDFDLDYTLQLADGSEITLGDSLNALKEKGWSHSYDETQTVEAHTFRATSTTLSNTKGNTIKVSIRNGTDKTVSIGECTIFEIISTQYSFFNYNKPVNECKNANAIGFTLCDTLTNQSSMEDVIDRLGAPYMVYCSTAFSSDNTFKNSSITLQYQQSSNGNYIKFEFSGDGKYLAGIEYYKR